VLAAVAEEEGANLTALVGKLGRSPGAIRDYLGWLLDVDALRADHKRYYYVDGLVREWVRLHGRGRPATDGELRAAARAVLATPPGAGAAVPAAEPAPEAVASRRDHLMEID